MAYLDEGTAVERKVHSLFVDVEEREGKLWGLAIATFTEPLTLREMLTLKAYVESQYADGLGESFEQQAIKIGQNELYVSLWANDRQFFIDTEHEFCNRLGLESPVAAPQRTSPDKPSVLAQLQDAKAAQPTTAPPHKKSEQER